MQSFQNQIEILPATISNCVVGVPYSVQLIPNGGGGAYSFSIMSGKLPTGLSINESGLISGTPTEVGEFVFGVIVQDTQGHAGGKIY